MTNELINEVKKINRQAALFMKRRIPLLIARGITQSDIYEEVELKRLVSRDKLIDTFCWNTTPQGFNFWCNISKQLPLPYGHR